MAGTLPSSKLFRMPDFRLNGLDEETLNFVREERLAIVLASEIEDNELLWTDYEYEEA